MLLQRRRKRKSMDQLQVKLLNPHGIVPTRAHATDVGFDLYACDSVDIRPWSRSLVPTGVAVRVPSGCYGRIAPRSGMAIVKSIDVAAGVVDPGYTGEIKVCLVNNSIDFARITRGMKIAQLVCERCAFPQLAVVDELNNTDRSTAGFGSSGFFFAKTQL